MDFSSQSSKDYLPLFFFIIDTHLCRLRDLPASYQYHETLMREIRGAINDSLKSRFLDSCGICSVLLFFIQSALTEQNHDIWGSLMPHSAGKTGGFRSRSRIEPAVCFRDHWPIVHTWCVHTRARGASAHRRGRQRRSIAMMTFLWFAGKTIRRWSRNSANFWILQNLYRVSNTRKTRQFCGSEKIGPRI